MHAFQQIKGGTLFSPTTSAVTTVRALTIDCGADGAEHALITVNMSAEKNTDATGVVIGIGYGETTATTISSHTTITANRTEDLATAHSVTYVVPTIKGRYLCVSATPDNSTNGNVVISGTYFLGRLDNGPSSTTDMRISTHDIMVVVS